MTEGRKTCGKCAEDKPTSGFSKSKGGRDGLQGWCKACCRSYHSARKTPGRKPAAVCRPGEPAAWRPANRGRFLFESVTDNGRGPMRVALDIPDPIPRSVANQLHRLIETLVGE